MGKLIIPKKYGQAPNELLNNPDLSLKAKGLFTLLQSKPDGWKFSTDRIAAQTKDGRDAVRRTLQELEQHGYLERKPSYDNKKKRLTGYDYILYENPKSSRQETRLTENQTTGNPQPLSNKDNSKKDIVINNKDTSDENVAGVILNEIIKLFEPINPSYEKIFSNKTQRKALERFIKKHGTEKTRRIIESLKISNAQPYSPTITTPLELENNIGKLIAFYQKAKNQKNKKAKKIIGL